MMTKIKFEKKKYYALYSSHRQNKQMSNYRWMDKETGMYAQQITTQL